MIESQQLLFVIGLGAVVLGLFWALHQTRAKLHQLQHEVIQIKNSIVGIKSIGIGQGKRLINVDSLIKKIENDSYKKTQLNQSSKQSEKNYQQAAKMLSMGVLAEDIMNCCGLTRGEMQLLVQLNSVSESPKSFH
jgi:hypothetical protein